MNLHLICALLVAPLLFNNVPIEAGNQIGKYDGVQVITINQVVDVLLREVRGVMRARLDPFPAGDQTVHVGLLNEATLHLQDMLLYNLSTIHRTDDMVIVDNPTMRTLNISLSVGFQDAMLSSRYTFSEVLPITRGNVTGTMSDLSVLLDIGYDFNTLRIYLTKFEIVNHSHVNVRFTNSLSSALLNVISPVITRVFSNMIMRILEGTVKTTINTIFETINEITTELLDKFLPQS